MKDQKTTLEMIAQALMDVTDKETYRSYTGRGMSKECSGVAVEDMGDVILILGDVIENLRGQLSPSQITEVFSKVESDTLGRGMIYYWRCLPALKGFDDDEE